MPNNTIIGTMINNKANTYTKGYLLLISALFIYLLLGYFITDFFSLSVSLFLILAITALFINQKSLEYRIAKGYYGANPYEVREIIQFITDNSSDIDPSGGTGLKLFTDEVETDVVVVKGTVTI